MVSFLMAAVPLAALAGVYISSLGRLMDSAFDDGPIPEFRPFRDHPFVMTAVCIVGTWYVLSWCATATVLSEYPWTRGLLA